MFSFDDLLLVLVIAMIVLLGVSLSSTIAGFLIVLIQGACDDSNTKSGGAKKSAEKNTTKQKKSAEKNTTSTTVDDIMLKEFTDRNITYNPIEYIIKKYGVSPIPDYVLDNQSFYMDRAKEIYGKAEIDAAIFDIDWKGLLGAQESLRLSQMTPRIDKGITGEVIDRLLHARLLDDEYPETTEYANVGYNVMSIKHMPYNENEYKQILDTVVDLAITESTRELNDDERKTLREFSDKFNSGKMTRPEMKIKYYDGKEQTVYNCSTRKLINPYSDVYKKLHWGQRKLLISEIDFFNRVALDIGVEKFKQSKISLVYPGSAHGHHLIIEMEMYPNLILYLWDPAMYNKILYMVDFMRRGLPITFQFSPEEMIAAKKYEGRVYINMELTNEEYITYHTNSTTGNSQENHKPQYGFFSQKSADAYLAHKKKTNDDSATLFCSDIRLFTDLDAANVIKNNHISGYSDLAAINAIYEHGRHQNYIRDMDLQKSWKEMVSAEYAVFKFKLKTRHYAVTDRAQYEYLDGDIVLQAWAPVSSTETRLFVRPAHKPIAYYNIVKYTDKLKVFNQHMRTHETADIKLSDLGIDISGKSDETVGDIWEQFLPRDLICMDAILEIYILYDYLMIYKKKEDIRASDLVLMISDITQTCLVPGNVEGILGYLDKSVDIDAIMNSRYKFHDSFRHRLDFHSHRGDRNICSITRNTPDHQKNNNNRNRY